MLLRLICLFTLIPLIELAILWKLTSLEITILIVIGTGIVGAFLARNQGMRWRETMARQLQRGEMPADGIFDGLLIFLAGALLVTPGVLTDVVGFGLLVPTFRTWVKKRIRKLDIRRRSYASDKVRPPCVHPHYSGRTFP